jgi:magnesium chelatase family protein
MQLKPDSSCSAKGIFNTNAMVFRPLNGHDWAAGVLSCNADMGPGHIREYCELDDTSKALMRSAMNQLGMSARAFHRVLKLARTIADLARTEKIQAAHLAEAIHLRSAKTASIGS